MVYSLYNLDEEGETVLYRRVIDSDESRRKVMTTTRRIADLRIWTNLLRLEAETGRNPLCVRVADYGCGWGTFLQVAVGPGVFVAGFDATPWKVDFARSMGVKVVDSEKELLTLAPFDLCVSTSVLEHLRDPRRAVNLIARLLKPQGCAHITCIVGGERFMGRFWREVRKKVKKGLPIQKEINPWEHLNYFSIESLRRLLGEFELTPINSPEGWRKYLPQALSRWHLSGYWRSSEESHEP